MQIGSSLSTHSLFVDGRRGAASVQPPRRAAAEDEATPQPRETFRLRPVEAEPVAAEQWESLPWPHRTALQSYLSNGPTVAERYGVELAGIDLFV